MDTDSASSGRQTASSSDATDNMRYNRSHPFVATCSAGLPSVLSLVLVLVSLHIDNNYVANIRATPSSKLSHSCTDYIESLTQITHELFERL